MAKDLTARQREIFEFIKEMIRAKGRPPSIREIGERFGIRSTNGVRAVLEALERKEYIRRDRYTSRGIELLKENDDMISADRFREIQWVGRVAAGSPIWAEQNIEGSFLIDRDFVPGEDVFSLKVQGDSMIDAGIFDGDFVLVKKQSMADPGDMVVAQIGDEATVKKFFPEKRRIRLEPANVNYGPIIVEKNTPGFSIAGKVIGLLRRM
ncbi:MAG: transcriptional repressor LexA [candidate division Zixibacteria bacterium]